MNNYQIDMGDITRVRKSHVTNYIHVHFSPNMMLLASFNLIIYGKKIFERAREISIISNMKFLNYNVSDHGML